MSPLSDVPQRAQDLRSLFEARRTDHFERFALMSEIEDAIHGRSPDRYDILFSRKDPRLQIRMIRTADDDLTALTSKVFPVYVSPKTQSIDNRKAAERVEKVAYAWNAGSAMRGGPEMDAIMHQLARYQVRFSDGVVCAYPDYQRKLIFFEVKDPRCHYPPKGWTPWSSVPLDNTLLVYEDTLGNLKARFPYVNQQLDNQYKSSFGYEGDYRPDDSHVCKVGEFYSRDAWYVATLDDNGVVLAESNTGDRNHPGVCPVTAFTQFSSDPLFAGQLGIEVALNKVMGQEIMGVDQMLHGPIFHSPLVGGNMQVNRPNVFDNSLGDKPLAMRLGPDSPMGTERVLGSLLGLARVLNRNPESFQGGGDANSAKAVQALQSGIRSTVQDVLWVPFISGFPKVYANCVAMERNLWPNERKTVTGKRGKDSFEVDYIPAVHLEGYEHRIKIEPGLGLGGYQQVLDLEQRFGAKLLSKRSFMEMVPDIRDAENELRRIDADRFDDLMWAVLESKAQTLDMRGLAEAKKLVDAKEMSWHEAIQKVTEQGLLEQAPPEMPEVPPELAAMMGGGGQAALPPPSLEEVRGP